MFVSDVAAPQGDLRDRYDDGLVADHVPDLVRPRRAYGRPDDDPFIIGLLIGFRDPPASPVGVDPSARRMLWRPAVDAWRRRLARRLRRGRVSFYELQVGHVHAGVAHVRLCPDREAGSPLVVWASNS